jgi:hypothetical protein
MRGNIQENGAAALSAKYSPLGLCKASQALGDVVFSEQLVLLCIPIAIK